MPKQYIQIGACNGKGAPDDKTKVSLANAYVYFRKLCNENKEKDDAKALDYL